MRRRDRTELGWLIIIMLVAGIIGVAYSILFYSDHPESSPLRGATAGMLIGGSVTAFELFFCGRPIGRWLVHRPFAQYLVVKTVIMLGIIFLILIFTAALFGENPRNLSSLDLVIDLIFSLAVSLIFAFFISIGRLLGTKTLQQLLTGQYHTPSLEQRVILFADLKNSTALAERIGDSAFLSYLSAVFSEFVDPVGNSGGEIYRYVGDGVIVTWPLERGLENASCVSCVREILKTLARRSSRFESLYQTAPEFRFALHAGPVMVGEIGDLKREIVYLGDTVNTTARIEGAAKDAGKDILISDDLLTHLKLPQGITAKALESVPLKGKANVLQLFSLESEAVTSDAVPA